jgi:hypothetical protein
MEAKFIEAEAQYILDNKPAAYTAYLEGITASMDKLGVDPADRDAYLAEASINLNNDPMAIQISHILKEKNIALILHPEIWTDMRRYDFDPAVFIDLNFPDNRDQTIPAGEWPRRAVYPESEASRNPNIEQVTEWWAPLWWDQ